MDKTLLDYATTEPEEELHEALIRCEVCTKVVPKAMLCLNCETPILYKTPETISSKGLRIDSK